MKCANSRIHVPGVAGLTFDFPVEEDRWVAFEAASVIPREIRDRGSR